ncbi:hypothetical protein QVD99_005048 [Batrachochytrium dendrobatidis]|nr:hypothetical protein O5D80_004508 [Batrachochytrium dendrobatidis]KAK5668003.1 hypothetical protein QVD99_005048 [Batrachochytrium dendrobatidis]
MVEMLMSEDTKLHMDVDEPIFSLIHNSTAPVCAIPDFEQLLQLTVQSGRLPAKLLIATKDAIDMDLNGSTLPVASILQSGDAATSVLKLIWTWQSPSVLSAIRIGMFGNQSDVPTVVVTDTAGKLTFLKHRPEVEGDGQVTATELDTKSSCISSMALGNLAHQTQLDIAIGDASGAVALVLGGKQIFIRKDIGSSVTCLAIQSRPTQRPCVVAGDSFGAITTFDFHDSVSTKIRLRDAVLPVLNTDVPACHMIRCIHPVTLLDSEGVLSHYILACDGTPFLYYLVAGHCVACVKLPSQISCITSGQLLKVPQSTNTVSQADTTKSQIAVGGTNGYIYLVDNLVVSMYANIDFPVTCIIPHRSPSFTPTEADLLLCAGHCANLFIFQDKQLLHRFKTSAWVWDMCSLDAKSQFAICTLDNLVQVIRFKADDDEEGELVDE